MIHNPHTVSCCMKDIAADDRSMMDAYFYCKRCLIWTFKINSNKIWAECIGMKANFIKTKFEKYVLTFYFIWTKS